MTNAISRRSFLNHSACLAAAAAGGGLLAGCGGAEASPLISPADDAYWRSVAAQYKLSTDIINLENGFYGAMTSGVQANYQSNIEKLNHQNSFDLQK